MAGTSLAAFLRNPFYTEGGASMRRPFRFRVALLALLVLAVSAGLFAQTVASARGSLGGLVKDETGAALPGASVQVVSEERGVSQSTTTDNTGRFQIPGLLPGKYNVTVSLS